MSIHDARIWVLITDGVTARICSSEGGITSPILVPIFPCAGPDDLSQGEEWTERLYRAWFRTNTQNCFAGSARRQLALHLAQILHEGGRERAYNGLIIVAARVILAELEQALSPETRALLIGKVVQDLPNFDVLEDGLRCEMRH